MPLVVLDRTKFLLPRRALDEEVAGADPSASAAGQEEEEPLSGAFLRGATSNMTVSELEAASAASHLGRRRRSKRTRMSKRSEARMCDLFRAMGTGGDDAVGDAGAKLEVGAPKCFDHDS